jgi:hypothetical protein
MGGGCLFRFWLLSLFRSCTGGYLLRTWAGGAAAAGGGGAAPGEGKDARELAAFWCAQWATAARQQGVQRTAGPACRLRKEGHGDVRC